MWDSCHRHRQGRRLELGPRSTVKVRGHDPNHGILEPDAPGPGGRKPIPKLARSRETRAWQCTFFSLENGRSGACSDELDTSPPVRGYRADPSLPADLRIRSPTPGMP